MPEIKRVTLHPLSGEGLVDLDVNLYPKTLINGVVDESGNEVEIVKRSDFDEAVNAIETEIDAKEEYLDTKKQDVLVSTVNIKTINEIDVIGEGNIELTKNSVGLYNVDNTSDLDKPISTAIQAALDEKQDIISDLDTIRTGALAGASAVQPAALEARLSTKQDTLVSGENIKTINGTSVLGSGDIVISTNSSFHSGWNVSGTTAEFYDSIIADTTVKAGDSFLGTLYCSDLPAGMHQAEAIVSIISRGANAAVDIALTSVEVSPYRWNYSRAWVNGGYITTGWIGLQAEITNNNKLAASKISGLASVATSGSYTDLNDKPVIPAAQVNADWNAVSGVAEILNKPTFATVATSGDYDDLLNKPVIPVVNYPVTDVQVGGTSVLNGTVAEIPALFDGDYTSLTNKPDLSVYALSASLAAVATSGSYNDLSNKPTIPVVPTNVSDFTNDAGYITSSYHDSTKQDTISDLDTIRSGAGLGATAVQPTAISDMATETWVGNQGYLTSVSWGDVTSKPTFATVATSGDYDDLINKPTIPAAQVQTDWNAISGMGVILNKPNLATVATTGAYSDLSGTPTLATVATSGSYTDLSNKPTIPPIPAAPQADGTYSLQVIVSSGSPTYVWTLDDQTNVLEEEQY